LTGFPATGLFLNGGRDNRIANNIFLECGQSEISIIPWLPFESAWNKNIDSYRKFYEECVSKPAWKSAGYLNLAPDHSLAANGTTLLGNRVENNIFVYRNPRAWLYDLPKFPAEGNQFDKNLVWHGGLPIATGAFATEKSLSANLLGSLTLSSRPGEAATWTVVAHAGESRADLADEGGVRAIALKSKPVTASAVWSEAIVATDSPKFEGQPGDTFEFIFRAKASNPAVAFKAVAIFFTKSGYKNTGEKAFVLSGEWREYRYSFSLPKAGEPRSFDDIFGFKIRAAVHTPNTTVWMAPVEICRTQSKDSWAAWTGAGHDQGSIVADPLFMNEKAGDYRLAPGSPALKLGFQQIPIRDIGYTSDAITVGWPIEIMR
jgi:hypothetical protein